MKAIFWLLSEQHKLVDAANSAGISPIQHYACVLAADLYRQKRKVHLLTADQDSAHQIDEWLWQFEPQRFIPHNLPGEGPAYGTPVEISWEASHKSGLCWVNTCPQIPSYLTNGKKIKEWHDFVPADEAGKVSARERYKKLKQLGFELSTSPIPAEIK